MDVPPAEMGWPGSQAGDRLVPTFLKKSMLPYAFPDTMSVRPSPSQSTAEGTGCFPANRLPSTSETCTAHARHQYRRAARRASSGIND
eukprot:scaffold98583_cov51-Prasinocladus_malaysianus.AAC.3